MTKKLPIHNYMTSDDIEARNKKATEIKGVRKSGEAIAKAMTVSSKDGEGREHRKFIDKFSHEDLLDHRTFNTTAGQADYSRKNPNYKAIPSKNADAISAMQNDKKTLSETEQLSKNLEFQLKETATVITTLKQKLGKEDIKNEGAETDEKEIMKAKIANKVTEIIAAVGAEQAKKYEECFTICDEKIADETEKNRIKETLLNDVAYEMVNGKRCIRMKAYKNRARQIDDTSLEDANQKFNLKIKQGNGMRKGKDFHDNIAYADRNYFDYKKSGITNVKQAVRDQYLPTNGMNGDLLQAFGGSGNSYTGLILEKLCNLGFPGVRNSDGSENGVGGRCSVLSSEVYSHEYVYTLYMDTYGNANQDGYGQHNARVLRCFEDSPAA